MQPPEGVYDLVLTNLSETVVLADERGFIVYVCPNAATVLGYSAEELQAFGRIGAFLGDDLFPPRSEHPGDVCTFERTLTGGDGRKRVFLIAVKEESFGGGTVVYVFRDVTESKRHIENLSRIKDEQDLLLDNIHTLVWFLTDPWTHGGVNRAVAEFFGMTRDELAQKSLGEILRDRMEADICLMGNTNAFTQKRQIRCHEWVTNAGGEKRLLAVTRTPKLDDKGNVACIVCSADDITEQRQAEMALAESERFLSSIFASVPDGISVVDKDLTIMRVNPAMESRYRNAAPLAGKKCYAAYVNRTVPCAVCPALRTIETGETQREVIPRPGIRGKSAGWVELNAFPLVETETGRVRGVVVFARNVTDRKQAEDLLIQNARLEAVAHLSAGVSHNFNNLLQIILGNADLALADITCGDICRLQHYLTRIVDNSRFGAKVVKSLQEFIATRCGATPVHTEILDLTDTVAKGLELAGSWWEADPKGHGKIIRLAHMLRTGCFVKGDKGQLLDVVVHLLRNAAEAVAGGGEIRITTEVKGSEVVLRVEDSGIGIAKEDQYRVFEPFYTTRGPQRIGMGLASSLGIVSGHSGKIEVQSEEGAGTAFTVRLPLATRPVAELRTEPAVSPVRQRSRSGREQSAGTNSHRRRRTT